MDKKRFLFGCLLIGGKSSRMGHPKHLIQDSFGQTWVERSVATLSLSVDKVFLSGKGEVPVSLSSTPRLEDRVGVAGPMAGILSALEYDSQADWLVVACDMPMIDESAVNWLVTQLKESRATAVIPKNSSTGKLEPLFACYRPECLEALRSLVQSGKFSISRIIDYSEVFCPVIPKVYAKSWANINRQEELEQLAVKDLLPTGQ